MRTHVQPTTGLHQLISFSPLFLLIVCPLGISLSLSLFITVSSVSANYTTGKPFFFFFFLNSFVSSPSPPTPFPHSVSFSVLLTLWLLFVLYSPPLFFFSLTHFLSTSPSISLFPLKCAGYGCSSCRPQTRRLLGGYMIKEILISFIAAEKTLPVDRFRPF